MASVEIKLQGRQIEDSRGKPTVQAVLTVDKVTGMGDVPAGASKGEDEAQTVETSQAIDNINKTLATMLKDAKLDLTKHEDVRRFERMMAEAAGDNFKRLGANAVVPVSRALWQAAAALHKTELYDYIRTFEPGVAGKGRVGFFMNIYNGGLHALKKKDGEILGKDRIDIQEIMVVPVGAKTYQQAVEMGDKIDQTLKGLLEGKYGKAAVTRADEAGFSVKGLGDSSVAIGHVFEAIEKAGFAPGKDVKLALDVAASSFLDKASGKYKFRGELVDSGQMTAYYVELVDQYKGKILSIEDGLAENDWDGWTKQTKALGDRGVVTIGDDLFVTQMPRLRRGVQAKSAHAILIKVNQNGSMLGTIEVMQFAKQNGMQCVVSHRSGETLDDSIADLAYATGAMGLKTGDPQPTTDFPDKKTWVRRVKYLRMVAIEARESGKR